MITLLEILLDPMLLSSHRGVFAELDCRWQFNAKLPARMGAIKPKIKNRSLEVFPKDTMFWFASTEFIQDFFESKFLNRFAIEEMQTLFEEWKRNNVATRFEDEMEEWKKFIEWAKVNQRFTDSATQKQIVVDRQTEAMKARSLEALDIVKRLISRINEDRR